MKLACFSVQIIFVVLDEDECTSGTHNCSVDAVCNNTQVSYNCTCKDGFYGDGINCTGNYLKYTLRWLNTVFANALARAIQRAHKDCIKQTWSLYGDHFICSMFALSILFFFIIAHRVLMVLLFYY